MPTGFMLGDDGRVHVGYYEIKFSSWLAETRCNAAAIRPLSDPEASRLGSHRRCPDCGPIVPTYEVAKLSDETSGHRSNNRNPS